MLFQAGTLMQFWRELNCYIHFTEPATMVALIYKNESVRWRLTLVKGFNDNNFTEPATMVALIYKNESVRWRLTLVKGFNDNNL